MLTLRRRCAALHGLARSDRGLSTPATFLRPSGSNCVQVRYQLNILLRCGLQSECHFKICRVGRVFETHHKSREIGGSRRLAPPYFFIPSAQSRAPSPQPQCASTSLCVFCARKSNHAATCGAVSLEQPIQSLRAVQPFCAASPAESVAA